MVGVCPDSAAAFHGTMGRLLRGWLRGAPGAGLRGPETDPTLLEAMQSLLLAASSHPSLWVLSSYKK